jgi:hypothetical protein
MRLALVNGRFWATRYLERPAASGRELPIIELAAMCVMLAGLLMNLVVTCSELGPLVRGRRRR